MSAEYAGNCKPLYWIGSESVKQSITMLEGQTHKASQKALKQALDRYSLTCPSLLHIESYNVKIV